MKKYICIILILLFCILNFVSCNTDDSGEIKYESYVTDVANDNLVSREKDFFDDNEIKYEDVAQHKAFTFDDKSYQLTIQNDSFYNRCGRIIDRYKQDDVIMYFYRDTGEFQGYHFSAVLRGEYLKKPDVEKEELKKKADKLAGEYIDINQYKQVEAEYKAFSSEMKYYYFAYGKYIDGYETNDLVIIELTSKGDLKTFNASNIGFYDDKKIEIDSDMLDKSINDKLEEIYSQYGEYTANIIGKKIICLPNGELAVETYVEVDLLSRGYATGVIITTIIE